MKSLYTRVTDRLLRVTSSRNKTINHSDYMPLSSRNSDEEKSVPYDVIPTLLRLGSFKIKLIS